MPTAVFPAHSWYSTGDREREKPGRQGGEPDGADRVKAVGPRRERLWQGELLEEGKRDAEKPVALFLPYMLTWTNLSWDFAELFPGFLTSLQVGDHFWFVGWRLCSWGESSRA